MVFLSNTRYQISRNKFAVAFFAIFFLATALSAGFIHNHAGDPFHTKEHNDCPVSVWAHTPFSHAVIAFQIILTAVIIAALSLTASLIPQLQYYSPQLSRAPPSISL